MTANFTALLSPRSVAIVGASPDLRIFRGRTLKVMLGHRFDGRIYPVSRSHDEVQGLLAYPSVAAIPEPVDLAVLIIPAEYVADELERCGAAGVKAALVLSSGFAETGTAAGSELQARIVAIARRHGMTLCGPNAEGYINTAASLCPTFSPVVERPTMQLVPPWRASGHVAVVAQSGGMGFGMFDRGLRAEHVRILKKHLAGVRVYLDIARQVRRSVLCFEFLDERFNLLSFFFDLRELFGLGLDRGRSIAASLPTTGGSGWRGSGLAVCGLAYEWQ